jgi:zinc protease
MKSVSSTNGSTPTPRRSLKTADVSAPLITQGVRKTVLDNGLTVLTKEVHTAPVVSVQVWYRVGSRNEQPGLNGIAHQLEHLMFKGTTSRPIQFGRLLSALGSDSNAFTSYDKTAYFGTVERDKLKALLVLEADRMHNALINAEQLASEKRVVISELQGYENSPEYRLGRAVMQAAFPNQAYGLPVGGTKADVERFTVEQVRDYYRMYYSPANATLVITGDFKTEPTLQTVTQVFGQVPKAEITPADPTKSKQSVKPTTPTAQTAKAPIVLRESGSAPLLQVVYPLPDIKHPDVPTLDVMSFILAEGRNSRLYQALVESGLASDLEGYTNNLIESGWYELSATAAPGHKLAEIDQVLQRSLSDIRNKAVSQEELQRAKTQLRAQVILQTREISDQAMQLANDQVTAGDYRFTDRYLAAIAQVSSADIKRVAQTYLNPVDRTVGFFEPTQYQGEASASPAGTKQTTENFSAGEPVDPSEVAKYLPPLSSEDTSAAQALPERLTLANGLRVLLLPDRSTPTVTLTGHLQAGTEFDPKDKAGLAELTAENLMNGTKTKSALAIAKVLEDRGAGLEFAVNREGAVVDGEGLSIDLPALIQTLADVLQNANFPAKELELSRQQSLTELTVRLDDPSYLGRRVFQQAVYPENHPFHSFPTPASLKRITRADVELFYRTHYRPDTMVLTLVGDFDPAQVRSLLEKQLGNWRVTSQSPTLTYSTVPLPKTVKRLNPVLPGKTQAVTYLGYSGIDRKDPRYYAALVLNEIVGGDTLASRLGTEIRDRQGLTYGIYSYFQAGEHPGPFLIQMQTAPEDTQQAIASTLALLQQLSQQGVTLAEANAAKRSISNNYPVELAAPENLANTILMNEVYKLDQAEIRRFPQQIEAVTLDQINQVAKELLHPDQLVVVSAGPPISGLPQPK